MKIWEAVLSNIALNYIKALSFGLTMGQAALHGEKEQLLGFIFNLEPQDTK